MGVLYFERELTEYIKALKIDKDIAMEIYNDSESKETQRIEIAKVNLYTEVITKLEKILDNS